MNKTVRNLKVVVATLLMIGVPWCSWADSNSAPAQSQTTPEMGPLRIYGNDAYMAPFRKPLPPETPRVRYPGFKPSASILKKGTIRRKGAMPLPCDILFERDVAMKLRDGTTIYTDIFRPATEGLYPALIAWSPYGKEVGGQWLDDVPFRAGVPLKSVSELQKFEGPDPAFWVNRGYVVLNPDPRGAYMSEGTITFWGRQLAEDGYDFIEWTAQQKWSSGKVALSGNSWLAISQWFIAAEQPPHLAAIAPWEGLVDHFREAGNRGGIPTAAFSEMIVETFAGKHLLEDHPRMILENQLMSPYWANESAKLERIAVPAYVVASYTSPVHAHGSFDGFRRISSKEKWLRVHNTMEWKDYYSPAYANDLLKFFDHYLKGADNGWERTPRVRLSVLNTTGDDVVDRPENEWPLARTRYKKLYLDEGNGLTDTAPAKNSKVTYDAKKGKVEFTYKFKEDTELTGYMNLHLTVEADGSDDMEIVVSVEKVNHFGILRKLLKGKLGSLPEVATGRLRVSQRALDVKKSTEAEPFLLNDHEDRLQPGERVPVQIGIWPMGMKYEKGDKLRLTVSAYRPDATDLPPIHFGEKKVPVPVGSETFLPSESPRLMYLGGKAETSPAYMKTQAVVDPPSRNKGRHIIHLGPGYDSYLLVPVVPQR